MKDCTVYKTIDIVGKRWSLCILLELYKGNDPHKRFNELKKRVKGITAKTLSTRLKEMEEDGLVKKELATSLPMPVHTYSLTESGEDLIGILQDLKQWGLKWKFDNRICSISICKECNR